MLQGHIVVYLVDFSHFEHLFRQRLIQICFVCLLSLLLFSCCLRNVLLIDFVSVLRSIFGYDKFTLRYGLLVRERLDTKESTSSIICCGLSPTQRVCDSDFNISKYVLCVKFIVAAARIMADNGSHRFELLKPIHVGASVQHRPLHGLVGRSRPIFPPY